jgi:predicted phage terminase large subunit-like protein
MTGNPEIADISPARLGEISMGKRRLSNGREINRFQRTPFVNLLNRELMAMFHGEFDNLAVAGPPRHSKTKMLTELASSDFLGHNPTKQVIAASHSAKLADRFGMNTRDLMLRLGESTYGVTVRKDRCAVDDWALTDGGGMLSIGVGGSLVGFGADLLIMDDIIADSKAALSQTVRDSTVDWYESTCETRLNAGAKQIFTMQRWHDDDPFARIVMKNPKNWRIIVVRALAEEDDILGRQPGEALWPEAFPAWKLLELQDRKPFWFAAQYQQRPVPRGGGMFQSKWFTDNLYHYPPAGCEWIRAWDLAASDGKGDWTVGVLMGRLGDKYYIENVKRGQWGETERDRIIRETTEEDNERFPLNVTTWGEQEPGSGGKTQAENFIKKLRPFAAHTEPSSHNKVVRADGFASACGANDVKMKYDPIWNETYVEELSRFPFGVKDDQVDASSLAYNKLALSLDPGGYASVSDTEAYDLEYVGAYN